MEPRVLSPVVLISLNGKSELQPTEVHPDRVGLKAWGLSCIPSDWTPPFCVLDASFVEHVTATGNDEQLHKLLDTIDWCHQDQKKRLIVRSSAVHETIHSRGALVSHRCSTASLLETLALCLAETNSDAQTVHWLLQPYVEQKCFGHLSNERRIAEAKRDWLLEHESIDVTTPRLDPLPIAIRKWREGNELTIAPLLCPSTIEIDKVLRIPAHWASDQKLRLHFEWVWDGSQVYIVQADSCEESDGISPYSLLPKTVPAPPFHELKCFRRAAQADFARYRKLSNAKLYTELGYTMPDFFVLDNPVLIKELTSGRPSDALLEDIKVLTTRPLVIRTDGVDIPSDDRQMLPRSDELRSEVAVLDWFTKKLPKDSEQIRHHSEKFAFVCHHFLPAAASAWSYAEPNKRIVRIEALWGIPEGMYWFSHDAYEVDTGDTEQTRAELNKSKFKLSKRERYKEWYIAPDQAGTWRSHKTDTKHDWKGVLKEEWYAEIANTTRRIAESLGYPVNLMWFLDVHQEASPHKILPWFHEKSELIKGGLKGSPRRKYSHSKMVEIRTAADLQALSSKSIDDLHGLNRITVTPSDPGLIRNTAFLSNLAEFVKKAGATIELSGGVLSHVFYILSRAGCAVEVVDLFGAKEETLVFRKLVRDKIPATIVGKGEQVIQVKLQGENVLTALKAKLIEEAIEVSDSTSTTEIIEELADVQEVVYAIIKQLKLSRSTIEAERKEKREKRGGFDEAKVLVQTSAPGSLVNSDALQIEGDMFDAISPPVKLSSLLEPDISLHQDTRAQGSSSERFLEVEFPAVMASPAHRVTEFAVSGITETGKVEVPLVGEWSLSRNGAQIRVRLSLRDRPLQGEFDFD